MRGEGVPSGGIGAFKVDGMGGSRGTLLPWSRLPMLLPLILVVADVTDRDLLQNWHIGKCAVMS